MAVAALADSDQLCIGLTVADEIKSSTGLSATNTFVTLSPTFMQVGPVDAMSPKIEEQVMARTNVQVWINEDAVARPEILPIKTYTHDMVLTKEQTVNVYSILYGSLITGFSNATPVYYNPENGSSNATVPTSNATTSDSNATEPTTTSSSNATATNPAPTGSNA